MPVGLKALFFCAKSQYTLIFQTRSRAESELSKVNAEIEAHLLRDNSPKINELYKKKNQLMEKIETLYNEWTDGESV